jgi:S1-C subfamily serine protease
VRFHVRGVDHLRVSGSSVPSKCPEQVFPNATPGPADKAIIDRCRRTILGRAIAPATAALQHVHDAADDAAIVHPLDAPDIRRQARFDPLPLLIAQPKQVPAHNPDPLPKTNQDRIVRVEKLMSSDPSVDMKDSAAAIRAIVNCVSEHPPGVPPSGPSPEPETRISGTGFFVAPKRVVTNNHVVSGCTKDIQVRYPDGRPYTATISGQDPNNDLVLLQTDMDNLSIAAFRFWPRIGEQVASYGFPYSGVLSSSGNFTLGHVTSLTGVKDDTRFLQMSAPIQPGNSGGAVLDMSGSVIGVAVARLDAIANSIPQNVNFAIQTPIVVNFLLVKGAAPEFGTWSAGAERPASEVADIAKKFTVQVYCQGKDSHWKCRPFGLVTF